jgi:tetratricopeptide (TPR) repeat protein
MNLFATIALLGWIPAVIGLFVSLPPRRAVVVAYVVAWLFLPNQAFSIHGLPDFTKTTATSEGVLLGALIFDNARLRGFRPRWPDLAMLAWCVCPFASSMSNGLGAYDGLSAVVSTAIIYGLPYFLGRIYLEGAGGPSELAAGIIVGGLVYVPLCLLEMRISPQLHRMVYGAAASNSFDQTIRYGGYRPTVFMSHGLEVGMWMTGTAMIAIWLWTAGSVKKVAGLAFAPFTLVLLVTAIFCKSTGAILQMVLGLVFLWSSRKSRTALPALVLAAIPSLYCGSRALGLWDGRMAVALTKTYLSEDRAGSLEFRLDNENLLIAKALQRPVFGWGGWGRARVYDEDGTDLTVTDGLWIIALGNEGIVGLLAHVMVLTLPLLVLIARYPARRWKDPDVAPHAALAILLALYMIDNLSNAMFNPIYYLAAGALLGPSPLNRRRADPDGSVRGGTDEALASAWRQAEGLEKQAISGGDWGEAARAWGGVVCDAQDRGNLAQHDLAEALSRLGLALTRLGRWSDAIAARSRSLDLITDLSAHHPKDVKTQLALASEMDALARLLAVTVSPKDRDPSRAVSLASRAVRIMPANPSFQNTLGAALLRTGCSSEAIAAIGRSIALGRCGGSRADFLILAIAYARLGDRNASRASLREADLRSKDDEPGIPELEEFQVEIALELAEAAIPPDATRPGTIQG